MKFDHTFIAIRERTQWEILDLSLHVIRAYFSTLVTLLFIGAIPWILVDLLLTHWLLEESAPMYIWVTTLLVINQAQVGTTYITYFLGQAMFSGELPLKQVLRESFRDFGFFLQLHYIRRLVIFALGIAVLMFLNYEVVDLVGSCAFFFLPLTVVVGVIVRNTRPFVTEMLLLERPERKKGTFANRSAGLHSSNDLFARSTMVNGFTLALAVSIYGISMLGCNALGIQKDSEFSMAPYLVPIALWIAAGFQAVVRFLSYIDLRIRQEGWAVELKMRAESMRLRGDYQ